MRPDTATSDLPAASLPRLQIMGPLRLWRGHVELDPGPHKQRCLLALLLAGAGRPVSVPSLVELLWGGESPDSAVNAIHKYVGRLRRLLEPDLPPRAGGSYLLRHGDGYRFTAGAETLDLTAFRQSVAAARYSLGHGDANEALDHYIAALGHCQGPSGDALAESVGAVATFARVDGEFLDAVVAAADVALRVGRAAEVLAALRLAAAMAPLNERVQASLMTALAAAGQQAEALAVFQAVRASLADELGIDPGAALLAAHQRVLTQAVRPAAAVDGRYSPPPATVARPAQLPPDLSVFVGRDEELAALGSLVAGIGEASRTSPLVVAMHGMGGVGKSTLATHFAHLVAGQFPDGQLHLDLRQDQGDAGGLSAADALSSLLYALGVSVPDMPGSLHARVGTYRSLTAGKRLLVLVDNAGDLAQVRPLLPSSARSLVLVTSRRPLVGLAALDGAYLLRVGLPSLPTARKLLRRRLTGLPSQPVGDADPEAIDEIIEWCGRLPSALVILSARIAARPGLPLPVLASELRDDTNRLAAFPANFGISDPRTTFAWSYRQLSPGAARLFRLSAPLPPGASAEACASLSGQDLILTRNELDELTQVALLDEDDTGRFSPHVLIRAYAEELGHGTDPAAGRRAAVSRLLQHYLHSSYHAQVMLEPNRTPIPPPPPSPGVLLPRLPSSYDEAIAWFAGQRDVLKEAIRLASDERCGVVPWQLAITMQQYLQWAGYFHDWEEVMSLALRAARERGDTVGEAHVLRSLAGARWSLGASEEALGLLWKALRVYEQRDMHLEQALVHSNAHRVYHTLGRHGQALEHVERATALFRVLDNRRGEATTFTLRGRSLTRLGRIEESAWMLGQAIEANQEIGRGHEEGEIRIAIAANLMKSGRAERAVDQLVMSADVSRKVGHRPNEFDALRYLAAALTDLGDAQGAIRALRQARAVLGQFQDGGTSTMRAACARLARRLALEDDVHPDTGVSGLMS